MLNIHKEWLSFRDWVEEGVTMGCNGSVRGVVGFAKQQYGLTGRKLHAEIRKLDGFEKLDFDTWIALVIKAYKVKKERKILL